MAQKNGIRTISHALPCSGSELRILGISDVHIGDLHCDMSIFKDLIKCIQDDPDCYTVLGGDLCNTALAGGRSDVYHETMSPAEQVKLVVKMLQPIKDKILAIVPGNHENRISRSVGFDISEDIAARLGLDELYRPTSALVFLTVGSGQGAAHGRPPTYSLYLNHGSGGGFTLGAKANGRKKQADVVDADIIMRGHTHTGGVDKISHFVCCNQNRTVDKRTQLLVNMASCLQYPESYADAMNLPPSDNDYPVIYLSTTRRHARAML